MSGLAGLEEERKAYQEQASLPPHFSSLSNTYISTDELLSLVGMLDENIAELKPKETPKPAPKQPSPPAEPPKWSKDNHPAFKKSAPSPVPDEKDDTPVTFAVNDMVQAKWLSGDKGFYPARITSITGSSTAPMYIVKFKGYDNTETLRARDIRPVSNKRKADSQPASGSSTSYAPASQSTPGVVSSAGATKYPESQSGTPIDAADGAKPPKAKKIKAKKELERGKTKWQEFNSKSKFGKSQKKESMFRTPDGVNARVGFTGSGQAMRKDPTRSRHVYEMNDELD
ncbi:splicing factor Spf30 [Sarocladium implicatum]|nr:splicing factor Spf30 [Sarocladium implicatum]